MSNNFSTSSGVTSLWTKMSGGDILSINDLRKARFRDGPGMKNSLLATPCQKKKRSALLVALSFPDGTFYVGNRKVNALHHHRPRSSHLLFCRDCRHII